MRIAWASLVVITACATTAPPPPDDHRTACAWSDFDRFIERLRSARHSAALTVAPPKQDWRIGDRVRITVVSPKSGRLLLISVNANGAVYPLFPSPQTGFGEDQINAGRPLTLPGDNPSYAFVTRPPLGEAQLFAIVAPVTYRPQLACVQTLTRGSAIMLRGTRGIRREHRHAPPANVDLSEWAFAEFRYQVIR